MQQVSRSIAALGWLYAAAGAPLPRFAGVLIVPSHERRRAEQAVRPRHDAQLQLPQGRGAVSVDWRVDVV